MIDVNGLQRAYDERCREVKIKNEGIWAAINLIELKDYEGAVKKLQRTYWRIP